MLRVNNYTTILLVVIVMILLAGVGIAVYYVLDLDWFKKPQVEIYKESNNNAETIKPEVIVEKKIQYDITKRTYNIILNTDELKIIVYKDGTAGLIMKENDKYKSIAGYNELLNKEVKTVLTNIIRVYDVNVSKKDVEKNTLLFLDSDGSLYELIEKELITNSKYVFSKLEGLANIIDVRQITNDNLTENLSGLNAIAVDQDSNELLLTDYLIKND